MLHLLAPELQERLDRELESGERVEWSGQPRPAWFPGGTLGLVLFGIPWTAFAVFWVAMAFWMTTQEPAKLPDNAPWFARLFPLFGLPFVLVGFGMLSSPYWAARRMRQTVYAVTDRRVILIEGGRNRTVRSLRPAQLQNLFRRERSDGSGDLILQQRGERDSDSDLRTTEVALLGIPDVQDVERRIRSLAETFVRPDDSRAS